MHFGIAHTLPDDDSRLLKYAEQRLERGFDDTETWCFSSVIARFMVPRLERFKELNCCYPPSLTPEEWDGILQEMIDGFKEMKLVDDWDVFDRSKVDRALELLSKWYLDLWW